MNQEPDNMDWNLRVMASGFAWSVAIGLVCWVCVYLMNYLTAQ